MAPPEIEIDPKRIAARLDAVPGLDRVRAAAERAGADAFLVGGTVRDLLLGDPRGDLDVAVEGNPAAIAAALGGGEVRAYERFGTVSVRSGDHAVDIAATRRESYAHPGALPEVEPASLREDLARRDFTVNAMAIPLRGEPELVDPHAGVEDLRDGVLRALHERSFADDPTRVLRGARYAVRLDLTPEPSTLAMLRAADLATVSADRIEADLRRLAAEPRAARGFELLAEWGLLELGEGSGERIATVGELAGRPPWRELDHREEAILAAARGERAPRDLLAATPERPSDAVLCARGHTPRELLLARAEGAEWLDRYVAEWRWVRGDIDGADLLAAGIPEGPAVGHGLAAALEAKLDGLAPGPREQLEIALAAAREALGSG